MNRRRFLRSFASWIKLGLLWQVFPLSSCAAGSIEEDTPVQSFSNGLRDFVANRLHHSGDGFVNPFRPDMKKGLWRFLKWKLFTENEFEPFFNQEKVVPVSIGWDSVVRDDFDLSVTFLKHSALVIRDKGQTILVDPVFSSPFWFIKDFSPLATDVKDMPKPDHVLITHGHYDHLDTGSLSRLPKDTHVVSPLGYNSVFKSLNMHNRTQMDWFDTYEDNGRQIVFLPCDHWTMRNPITGPNKSLWGSYYIRTAAGPHIYISGDTAYFAGYEQLGSQYPTDLAIFNLGAYEPRWFMYQSHMNPAETGDAFRLMNARHLAVVHWGTFRLGNEPVHFPPLDMRKEMEKQGMAERLVHIDHGRTLFVRKNGDLVYPDSAVV